MSQGKESVHGFQARLPRIEEVRSSLTLRHMSDIEQVFFVFDLLEGEAKAEVKFRTPAERNTPEKIFSILRETYGCSKSYIGLQTQFFQRKQMEGESLREYSHDLMSLIESVKRRDPQCFANPDSVLRDQFIEHVRDNMLRRELKRRGRMDPSVSFLDIRTEAIQWVEEGEHIGSQRPRAYSYSAQGMVGEIQTNVAAVQSVDELKDLKECLCKQQVQLDAIMRHLEPPTFHKRYDVHPRSNKFPYQPDGKPICIRCNKPGHIARFCNVDLKSSQEVSGRDGPQSVRHSVTVRSTVNQSEN